MSSVLESAHRDSIEYYLWESNKVVCAPGRKKSPYIILNSNRYYAPCAFFFVSFRSED